MFTKYQIFVLFSNNLNEISITTNPMLIQCLRYLPKRNPMYRLSDAQDYEKFRGYIQTNMPSTSASFSQQRFLDPAFAV